MRRAGQWPWRAALAGLDRQQVVAQPAGGLCWRRAQRAEGIDADQLLHPLGQAGREQGGDAGTQ
jgi:hypothetical protein